MTRTPIYRPCIDDIKGDQDWSALEADLLAECKLGRMACLPGKTDLPADCDDPDRRVRAGLIRYLMLGGCDGEEGARPHPMGVWIRGGWIDGVLDLQSCRSDLDLGLQHCRIPQRPILRDARIGALYLPGSALPQGASLHRLRTEGDVHLRDGFQADALVDLGGAEIGGQLDCTGGKFLAEEDRALDCNAARVGADVFLSGGFEARAEVVFRRTGIGGQLDCTGGKFLAGKGWALNCDAARIGASVFLSEGFEARAEVNLVGAEIGGQLDCSDGKFLAEKDRALDCEAARIGADVFLRGGFEAKAGVDFSRAEIAGNLRIQSATLGLGFDGEAMRVGHGFFWQKVAGDRRFVNLTEAHVGSLRDDWESWKDVGTLILDGFRYDRLENSMPVGRRLDWLRKNWRRPIVPGPGAPDGAGGLDFDPQPYVHLAAVLRAQGDRAGAADVLVEREIRQRRATRLRVEAALDGTKSAAWESVAELFKRPMNLLFRHMFGYGHKPMRALLWVLIFVVFGAWLYGTAYDAGQMAPNSDVVLTSAEWLAAVAAHEAGGPVPLQSWLDGDSAQDHESFNPWIYGLDLFVPLDALGQEAAWAPSPARGDWGVAGFWLRPFIQAAGWIMTALGAAVLTGLVGRRD